MPFTMSRMSQFGGEAAGEGGGTLGGRSKVM